MSPFLICASHFFAVSVSVFRPLSLCFLCLERRSKRNQSRDDPRDTFSPNGQNSNQSQTQFCSTSSSSFCQRRVNFFSFSEQQEQRDSSVSRLSLSLSLSLSLFFVRFLRFACVLFALKCEGRECLFPSSKSASEHTHTHTKCLGCVQNPKN